MAVPVKPKYPLFLKDIGKCDCEPNGGSGDVNIDGISYPLVNVNLDENIPVITLNPNTFYNIHTSVPYCIINFSSIQELNNISGNYEIFSANCDYAELQELLNMLIIGGILEETNELEGYLFKQVINVQGIDISIYFATNPNSSTINHIKVLGIPYDGMEELELDIYDVTRINKDDTLHKINVMGTEIITYFIETTSDMNNKHKYIAFIYGQEVYAYTDKPINECENIEIVMDEEIIPGNIEIISSYKEVKFVNEFVFSINTPVQLEFGGSIYFNNDNVPITETEGILTISILSGLACYTFKPK